MLRELQPLIPDWCRDLDIEWVAEPRPRGNILAVSTSYRYRQATLYVCPLWLECDERLRRASLTHEISHLVNAPLAEFARRLVDELIPPDHEMRAFIEDGLTEANESATCDLEHLLSNV